MSLEVGKYVAAFVIAFAVTYLFTPWGMRLARRWGFIDVPDGRRIHDKVIPRAGGVGVFLGFHAGCATVFFIPWGGFDGQLRLDWWWQILPPSVFLLLVGLVDDRRGVPALAKLGAQAVAGLWVYFAGLRFGALLGLDLYAGFDVVFTVLWCVGFINAFNLIDGLDGLAAGLGLIAALGLGGSFVLRQYPGDTLVVLAFAGACLAFLRYNFHPAQVFLGDTGSMFLGFTLATISLGSNTKSTVLTAMAVPVLVAGVPILDAALAIWRRSLGRWGRPAAAPGDRSSGGVMEADKNHLHHRLLRLFGSQRRVAGVLYAFNAVLVLFALAGVAFQSWAGGIYVLAFGLGTYVIVRHLAQVEMWNSGKILARGLRRPSRKVLVVLAYPVLDLALLVVALGASLAYLGGGVPGWRELKPLLLRDAPWWVGVPFAAMVASNTYRRVWSKARLSDFLMLGFALVAGFLLAGLVDGLSSSEPTARVWGRSVAALGVALPLAVGLRLAPRLMLDMAALVDSKRTHSEGRVERVLLYGAGFGFVLYLRSRTYKLDLDAATSVIVGVADDDPNLQGRYLYGFRVLGNLGAVPRLVEEHRVTRIIVTTDLRPEVVAELHRISQARGLALLRWREAVEPYSADCCREFCQTALPRLTTGLGTATAATLPPTLMDLVRSLGCLTQAAQCHVWVPAPGNGTAWQVHSLAGGDGGVGVAEEVLPCGAGAGAVADQSPTPPAAAGGHGGSGTVALLSLDEWRRQPGSFPLPAVVRDGHPGHWTVIPLAGGGGVLGGIAVLSALPWQEWEPQVRCAVQVTAGALAAALRRGQGGGGPIGQRRSGAGVEVPASGFVAKA